MVELALKFSTVSLPPKVTLPTLFPHLGEHLDESSVQGEGRVFLSEKLKVKIWWYMCDSLAVNKSWVNRPEEGRQHLRITKLLI